MQILKKEVILLLVKPGLKLLPFQLLLEVLHSLLQSLLGGYLHLLQRNGILLDLLSHIHHDHQLIVAAHHQFLLAQVHYQLVELLAVIGDLPEVVGEAAVAEATEVDPVLRGMRDVYDERTLGQLQTHVETATDLPLTPIHTVW